MIICIIFNFSYLCCVEYVRVGTPLSISRSSSLAAKIKGKWAALDWNVSCKNVILLSFILSFLRTEGPVPAPSSSNELLFVGKFTRCTRRVPIARGAGTRLARRMFFRAWPNLLPFQEGKFGTVWALDGNNSNSQTRHVSKSTTNSWSELVQLKSHLDNECDVEVGLRTAVVEYLISLPRDPCKGREWLQICYPYILVSGSFYLD